MIEKTVYVLIFDDHTGEPREFLNVYGTLAEAQSEKTKQSTWQGSVCEGYEILPRVVRFAEPGDK
ncbi:MAG: hypothetical protein EOO40_00450 [Deltaproteobacteria bacterium]|nr:MAG: hypothetical protein EOO40_00450 [Deltaproteobacteria bacterium]